MDQFLTPIRIPKVEAASSSLVPHSIAFSTATGPDPIQCANPGAEITHMDALSQGDS